MGTYTYEELLALQTELAHFNPNHDPRNGQFAKSPSGISTKEKVQESRHRQNVIKEQKNHFNSQLPRHLQKLVTISANGYPVQGPSWNTEYRRGRVTKKDDETVKKAASNTRKYIKERYGEDIHKRLVSNEAFVNDQESKKEVFSNAVTALIKSAYSTRRQIHENEFFNGDISRELKVNMIKNGITAATKSTIASVLSDSGNEEAAKFVESSAKKDRDQYYWMHVSLE